MLLSKVLQNALPELKQGFGVVADYEEYALFKNNGVHSKLWKLIIMKASEAQSTHPEFKAFVGVVDDANQVHLVENISVSTAFVNRVKRGNLGGMKMSRLPVTFVFNNAIYSESSNHHYFKRESGKPIKIISENQFAQARDQFLALRKSIKPKPNPKPKHPKSVKYDGNDLSLTEKQVDFLKALNTVISQCDSKGSISVSDFMEKTNSCFHDNPMAVGAMLTTLQHKNVLATWKEESTNTRVVRIEKLGLDALKQIGGNEPCK